MKRKHRRKGSKWWGEKRGEKEKLNGRERQWGGGREGEREKGRNIEVSGSQKLYLIM